jgi:apolipoprotein D and lipocalin family protein
MRAIRHLFPALALACAVPTLADAALSAAPSPVKPVQISRYLGRWYEFARLHNRIEENCARAEAQYSRDADGRIAAVETCHTSGGGEKVYHAGVHVLDPGTNAKLRLSFFPFISKDYWVLDHAPDYSWAIVGTNDGKYLWLFTRRPDAPAAETTAIVARARALGYDTSQLIYSQGYGPA